MGTPILKGSFETLGEAMGAAAEQFGAHDAYVEMDRRLTFAEWLRAADSFAMTLAERGVRKGEVVALWVESSLEYAIACAAAIRLGAIATGINTRLGPNEVTAIARCAAPRIWIVDDRFAVSDVLRGSEIIKRSEFDAMCARAPLSPEQRPASSPSDPVTIIWTSGTTGVPKGAWFDHRNLAAAIRLAGPMSAAFDRKLSATPFAHAGYMSKLWDQVAFGTATIVPPVPWNASSAVDLMVRERVTVAAGVPTQWAKLLDEPRLNAAALPSLRLCVAATAPMPPELVAAVEKRLGAPTIIRYAMTESPTITGTSPGDPPEALHRTVGRPLPHVDVTITDADGQLLSKGETGRIRVRGPAVMRGYWNAPEETAKALTPDGWLISSDLGHFDEEGFLVLAGRASEMYIRGGYNVYPLEVENVLAAHPGIAQIAVVGIPAPVIGEIGVAFVVPRNSKEPPSLEDLRAWCRARLADYKQPDRVEILDALPLTTMMKVDKAALRRMSVASPGTTRHALRNMGERDGSST